MVRNALRSALGLFVLAGDLVALGPGSADGTTAGPTSSPPDAGTATGTPTLSGSEAGERAVAAGKERIAGAVDGWERLTDRSFGIHL